MRALARGLAAGTAGLGAAAAFPPVGVAWLAPVAVALLLFSLAGTRGRSAALLGMLFGAVFMLGLLPWAQVIGVDAWIGLSLLQAAFYALLGPALARIMTLPFWPVWAAAAWVGMELLRSTLPWGGFPWGRLGFTTVDTPLAPLVAWVGVPGATFLVALLGSTLAWLLLTIRRSPARSLLASGATVAALATLAVPATLVLPDASTTESSRSVRVAAVQGNVPGEGMDAFAERRAVLNNHVEATLGLAEQIDAGESRQPDLVLWPENSTDIDPFEDASVYADIQGAVDAVAVPTLVGAMVGGPGPIDVRNQGIVWEPGTGPAATYSKTHPVPFGEYIPHRAQLAQLFERLDQIPRDMVPGTEPGVLEMAGITLGDVICFEVAYDGLVHDVVDGGAEMLVVQTNNATYMGTGQIEQQFAISRLRALETGRYVVVVATNGISGIVAPDGSVLQRAPVRETAVLQADIPLRSQITASVRVGPWLGVGLALLGALGYAIAVRRTAGGQRKDGAPMAATGDEAQPARAQSSVSR